MTTMTSALPEPPRRGRPRNLARRREIARAALVLFADNGYHGCTMREIARHAGIGDTLLYRYYRSKREVLGAVLDFVLQRLVALHDALHAVTEEAGDLREYLKRVAAAYIEHVSSMHAWYSLWISGAPLDLEQRARIRDAEELSFTTIAAGMRLRGVFGDPYVATRAFTGALGAMVLVQERARFEPPSADLREIFIDQLIAFMLPHGGAGPG